MTEKASSISIEMYGDETDLAALVAEFSGWPGVSVDLDILSDSFIVTFRGTRATLKELRVALEQYRICTLLVNARIASDDTAEA